MLEGSSWELACIWFGVPSGRNRVIILMRELGFLKGFLMKNTLSRLIHKSPLIAQSCAHTGDKPEGYSIQDAPRGLPRVLAGEQSPAEEAHSHRDPTVGTGWHLPGTREPFLDGVCGEEAGLHGHRAASPCLPECLPLRPLRPYACRRGSPRFLFCRIRTLTAITFISRLVVRIRER